MTIAGIAVTIAGITTTIARIAVTIAGITTTIAGIAVTIYRKTEIDTGKPTAVSMDRRDGHGLHPAAPEKPEKEDGTTENQLGGHGDPHAVQPIDRRQQSSQ